jgi:hypothetical protein
VTRRLSSRSTAQLWVVLLLLALFALALALAFWRVGSYDGAVALPRPATTGQPT